MSILSYPSDGLNPHAKTDIDDCSHSISNALSDCYFDIPWNFAQRDYLKRLEGTINSYRQELNAIKSEISKADHDYSKTSERFVINIGLIESPKITRRTRRIK